MIDILRSEQRVDLHGHRAAPTPETARRREALAQHLHQRGTEPVARLLGRDEETFRRCGLARCISQPGPMTKSGWRSRLDQACGSAASVCRDHGDPPIPARAPDRPRPMVGRSRQILAALGRPSQHANAGLGADTALGAARDAANSRRCLDVLDRNDMRSITTAACPMSNGASASSTPRPRAMSASASPSGTVRVTAPRHQEIGCDVLDSDLRNPAARDAATLATNIVAARNARMTWPSSRSVPSEPDLRQRRPHQRADEDRSRSLVAEQPCRRPSWRRVSDDEALRARRIAGAAQRDRPADAAREPVNPPPQRMGHRRDTPTARRAGSR